MDIQNVSPQPHSLFSLPVIIGSIVVLFVGLVGGFYLAKRQTTLQPVTILNPTAIPSLTPTPPSINQEKITTYVACGCGCCGGTTPNKKCLYHSKGDILDKIIQEDKKIKENPQCSTAGCSIGTEYSYCD